MKKNMVKNNVHFGFKEYLRIALFLLGLIALAFGAYRFRLSQKNKIPDQILESAPVEIETSSTASASEAVTDDIENNDADLEIENASEEETEEEPGQQNIDTAQEYINFERLIMQISEYTQPDEKAVDNSDEETSEVIEYTAETDEEGTDDEQVSEEEQE